MGRFRDTGLAFEEKFLEIAERRIGLHTNRISLLSFPLIIMVSLHAH